MLLVNVLGVGCLMRNTKSATSSSTFGETLHIISLEFSALGRFLNHVYGKCFELNYPAPLLRAAIGV